MFLLPVCFCCPYPRYFCSLVSSGGEFQMFPLAPRRSLRLAFTGIGGSMHSVTFTLAYSQNKAAQGAARGCQNIMGFFDGADQGRNAKTRCTVIAARHEKHENTLIVELPVVFNNAQKPCGGCVVEFPHLFWQPRTAPCADLRSKYRCPVLSAIL